MPRKFEGFSYKPHLTVIELITEQMEYANMKADQAVHDPNVEQEYWRGWYNAMNNLKNKILQER